MVSEAPRNTWRCGDGDPWICLGEKSGTWIYRSLAMQTCCKDKSRPFIESRYEIYELKRVPPNKSENQITSQMHEFRRNIAR